MALVLVDAFDSLTGWTNTGTAVISSAQSIESGNSLLIDATGSAKHVQKASAGAARIVVVRLYYRIETDTSGSASIIQMSNTAGNLLLQARTGRKIRPFINATGGTDSAALNLNQWYRLDILFDASANPAAITWQIDGVAQTGQTGAQTATNFGNLLIGNTASNTYKVYFDMLRTSDTAGEYPLGEAFLDGAAGNAAGTGAASNAGKTEQPNAANSAGTGAGYNASETVAATSQASAGTGTASNPTIVLVATAEAEASAGTGAAANASETILAPIQASAGTGAASNATGTQAVNAAAEIASGSGAAAHLVSASLVSSPVSAAGVSTAQDPVVDADSGALPEVATATGSALNASVHSKPVVEAALGTESTVNVVTDTFTRTASSSLGPADTGQAWTTVGTASAYTVGSGVATFAHTASNQARRAWLSTVVLHDVDQTFRWKGPAVSGSDHHIFLRLRQLVSGDGDALMPKLLISGTSMTLSLVRRAVSVETELASTTLGISFEADTYYTFRTRLLGQGLFAKVWKSSDSEPANWQVWATDTQLAAPGGIGMATYSPPGATYPFSFTWDDLDTDEIRGSAAYNPTVLAVSTVYAAAITAVGTGAAADMTAALSAPISAATGTGAGYNLSVDMLLSEGVGNASGTGTANNISSTSQIYAGASSGIGAAWGLTGTIAFAAQLADAGADAFNASFGLGAPTTLAAGVGAAYDMTAFITEPLAGFGTVSFRSAGGSISFRSAGASLTIGGH